MKLRNKKTGEIGYFCSANWNDPVLIIMDKDGIQLAKYKSLAELNEEWTDAPEESKEHWCVTMYGGITRIKDDEEPIDDLIEIGNYFNSKEDAYDAWDELKAWKRLKDKGFRFKGFEVFSGGLLEIDGVLPALKEADNVERLKIIDDLDLLFLQEDD